jgi:hypothetical protein
MDQYDREEVLKNLRSDFEQRVEPKFRGDAKYKEVYVAYRSLLLLLEYPFGVFEKDTAGINQERYNKMLDELGERDLPAMNEVPFVSKEMTFNVEVFDGLLANKLKFPTAYAKKYALQNLQDFFSFDVNTIGPAIYVASKNRLQSLEKQSVSDFDKKVNDVLEKNLISMAKMSKYEKQKKIKEFGEMLPDRIVKVSNDNGDVMDDPEYVALLSLIALFGYEKKLQLIVQ